MGGRFGIPVEYCSSTGSVGRDQLIVETVLTTRSFSEADRKAQERCSPDSYARGRRRRDSISIFPRGRSTCGRAIHEYVCVERTAPRFKYNR